VEYLRTVIESTGDIAINYEHFADYEEEIKALANELNLQVNMHSEIGLVELTKQ
jgi:hypothetical protein